MSTELQNVQNAVEKFDKVAAGIATLRKEYEGVVYDVTTTEGMKAAKEARKAVSKPRIEIEKIRKEAKAPILELGRKLDGEAKRITEELLAIENPINEQIAAHEAKLEAERQALIKAEQDRVALIQHQLIRLQAIPQSYSSAVEPAKLQAVITQLEDGLTFDYAEFADQAETARQAALIALRPMHIEALERIEREAAAEAERVAQERRLLEERARFEAEQAEARRQREAEEARLAAERQAQEEALAAQRAELERAAREQAEREAEISRKEREAREAEEARKAAVKAELDRKAAEAAREREAEAKREALRQRVNSLSAGEIVGIVAAAIGADVNTIAARMADISHDEWVAISMSEETA